MRGCMEVVDVIQGANSCRVHSINERCVSPSQLVVASILGIPHLIRLPERVNHDFTFS